MSTTSIPTNRYPLTCFRTEAKRKLGELANARLVDNCAEDREYAYLLRVFLRVIDTPFLPYSITQMRSYSQYLARIGEFDSYVDEEIEEGGAPTTMLLDIYLESYRDIR